MGDQPTWMHAEANVAKGQDEVHRARLKLVDVFDADATKWFADLGEIGRKLLEVQAEMAHRRRLVEGGGQDLEG